jgi:hypothetical protein
VRIVTSGVCVSVETKGHSVLDAIEKAVRNALEKGDATDKNYRRRVYVSARHALEKSMKGKKLTQDAVDDRFSKLTEIAAMIESEFTEAEGEVQYPSPGRRAYEAAPPLLDEVRSSENQTPVGAEREFDETFAHSSAEEAFMGGPPDDNAEEDVPVSFEDETSDEVVEEAAKPAKSSKAKKKPRAAKKAIKRTTVSETPSEPVAAVDSEPSPDLFEGERPDWDEVSIGTKNNEQSELNQRYEALLNLQDEDPKPVGEELREDVAADDEYASGDLARLDGADDEIVETAVEAGTGTTSEVTEKTLEISKLEPSVAADEVVTEQHIEVHQAEPVAADTAVETPYVRPVPKGRYDRGLGFSLMLITCLAVLVMGVWFAVSNGALRLRGTAEVADTTVTVAPQDLPEAEKPAVTAGDQTAAQVPAAAPADNWLMIFRPENPGELVVDPTISANVKGSGPLAHLRVEPAKSSTGDAAVVFSIGQGVLEQIAGKRAVFDIVAAADDGNPTQISVFCDFAGLGDCGRKRFQIDAATSDNLFQIEFPAGQPTGSGQIVLNPDVEGKGRALEIYAIKVRVAN